jgi:rhodanese-related sulfurtransferase
MISWLEGLPEPPWQRWPRVLRDGVLVVALSLLGAAGLNLLRSEPLPWYQTEPHQIMVPCPETLGEARAVPPGELPQDDPRLLLLDARPQTEFDAWHPEGAILATYDWLEPVSPQLIKNAAASGAREVVVLGDGGDPDCGEMLARELAGKGLKNVGFVQGGASALRAAWEGGAP